MRLLQLLMGRPRRVHTAEVILERVWGQEGTDLSQLKNVIYRLRRKIEPDPHHPHYLHTAPGHGYFFGTR
jgi:two-component system KDP operon response regulator KdpE